MSTEDIKKTIPVEPMVFDDEPKKKSDRPMVFDTPSKSFEDKTYIVLIKTTENDDPDNFDGKFKICEGRTDCYRYIEKLLESYDDEIDIYQSMIITETKQTETDTGDTKYYLINLPECISIYAFCKSVQEYYGQYGFDIEKYANHTIMTSESEEDEVSPDRELVDFLHSMQKSIISRPIDPFIENKSSRPAREEFPGLFEDDDDGSVNV